MKNIMFITFFLFVGCSNNDQDIWIFSGELKACTHLFKADGQAYTMAEIQLSYPNCTAKYNKDLQVTVLDCTEAIIGGIYVFSKTKEICENFRKKYYELKHL